MNLDRLPDPEDYEDLGEDVTGTYDDALRWALGRYYDPKARALVPSSISAFGIAIMTDSFGMLLLAAAFTLGWSVWLVREERRWSPEEGSA